MFIGFQVQLSSSSEAELQSLNLNLKSWTIPAAGVLVEIR